MARRSLAAALAATALATTALLGCRPGTVSVAYAPEVGDRYAYRYEIEATVTRSVEGAPAERSRVDTELVARQEVRARTARGARISLELSGEAGSTRRAIAIVDRAGSLEGIELPAGVGTALLGAGDALVPNLPGPPDHPLAPGETWSIDRGARRGEGRLERLGVIDGSDVAVVRTTATEQLRRTVQAGASDTSLRGAVRSSAATSYDLADGAVRRSRSSSHADVQARIDPPPGVDAEPVLAEIAFDVTVRVTRVG